MILLATDSEGSVIFSVSDEGLHGLGVLVSPDAAPLIMNVQSLLLHGGPWEPAADRELDLSDAEIGRALARAEAALSLDHKRGV